jgi:ribosomal protein S27E
MPTDRHIGTTNVRCPDCRNPMALVGTNAGPRYRCPSCGRITPTR